MVECLEYSLLHPLSLITCTFRENRDFVFSIIVQFMMSANNRTRSGLQIVFVCLYITLSHYHHCANLSDDIELIKCHSDIFCVGIRLSIFSQLCIIQYMGLCIFRLPISLVMFKRIYTLSYYHHQIGSMKYFPLFRVRSWNNGLRCMSLYFYRHYAYLNDCKMPQVLRKWRLNRKCNVTLSVKWYILSIKLFLYIPPSFFPSMMSFTSGKPVQCANVFFVLWWDAIMNVLFWITNSNWFTLRPSTPTPWTITWSVCYCFFSLFVMRSNTVLFWITNNWFTLWNLTPQPQTTPHPLTPDQKSTGHAWGSSRTVS